MKQLIPCMGGFCQVREDCAHYHSTWLCPPANRLCPKGGEEPEPIRVFKPVATKIETNTDHLRGNRHEQP